MDITITFHGPRSISMLDSPQMAVSTQPRVSQPTLQGMHSRTNSDFCDTASKPTRKLEGLSHRVRVSSRCARQFPHFHQHPTQDPPRVMLPGRMAVAETRLFTSIWLTETEIDYPRGFNSGLRRNVFAQALLAPSRT